MEGYKPQDFSFFHRSEKLVQQMFDAWDISIFVGFDFHNVDALRLKSRKELLTLLFRKLLILRIYGIYIVDHDDYS